MARESTRLVLLCALLSHCASPPDSGADPLLAGLDEAVLISEVELDQAFPLVNPVSPEEDDAPADPSQGGAIEAALAAYKPTREPAAHFVIQPNANVPAAFVEQAKKGILFAMDRIEAMLPGVGLFAGTAARPFDVAIFDQPKGELGFRPHVSPCPNLPADWASCRPRLNLPYEIPAGQATARAIPAGAYVHELGHVGHAYYTMSAAYIAAGGLPMGAFRHDTFRWQREGSANFLMAHAPDWTAYSRLSAKRCAFEALHRGAFQWKDFLPTGAEKYLPYQLSLLVDQVSFHHFGGDTAWLMKWWVARPDARDPSRPETAARALMRLLSPKASAVDLSALNRLLVAAGRDLYGEGKNPWTTRALTSECYRSAAPAALSASGSASANLVVPPLAFDALRMDIADGAATSATDLRVSLSAGRLPNLRALVYLVQIDPYLACIAALDGPALGAPEPRAACNAKHLVLLGALTPASAHSVNVTLTSAQKAALGTYDLVTVVFHVARPTDPRTDISATVTAEFRTAAPPASAPGHLCVVFKNGGPDSMMMRTPDQAPLINWRVSAGTSIGRFIEPRSPKTWFVAHKGNFITTEQPEVEVACDLTDAVVARAAQKAKGATGPGVEFCTSTDASMPRVAWDGKTLKCEGW